MFPSQRRSSGVWNQERGSAGPCLVSCLSCRQARGGRQDRRAGRQRGGEDLGRTRGRRWHRAQREKPGGHGKDWEIALGSHGAQWGRILTAGRAGDLGVCCTWATGDWLGCWGERATTGMCGRTIWRPTTGKMVLQRPGSGSRAVCSHAAVDTTWSKPVGLLNLQVGSANAPGDGQKKTSLTTAAEVCYYELGKVTKDLALKVDALVTTASARFHHK